MSFIDWHGDREDHYEEVVAYAKNRQLQERRQKEDIVIRDWFSRKLAEAGLGGMQMKTVTAAQVLSLFIQQYAKSEKNRKEMDGEIRAHMLSGIDRRFHSDPVDPLLRFRQDLWLCTLEDLTELASFTDERRTEFVNGMMTKVFHFADFTPFETHIRAASDNKRYTTYLTKAFRFMKLEWAYNEDAVENTVPVCWQILAGMSPMGTDGLRCYRSCLLLLALYLYLAMEADGTWVFMLEPVLEKMESASGCNRSTWLFNPLYDRIDEAMLRNLFRERRVLFFARMQDVSKKGREGEITMIEELYRAAAENTISNIGMKSILPENVRRQISNGTLAEFPGESGEFVFFLDHSILIQGVENAGEIGFRTFEGTFVLVNDRMIFKGSRSVEIPFERIDHIVVYDAIPEFMEVVCNGRSVFFRLPDVECAYKCLKLIANREKGMSVPEKPLPFDYEELIKNADLEAYIFSFSYLKDGALPEALKQRIAGMLVRLKGLSETMKNYPQRKEEIEKFLEYPLPELLHVLLEYRKYQGSGADPAAIARLNKRLADAIEALDGAATRMIERIYDAEILDASIRADALAKILGLKY